MGIYTYAINVICILVGSKNQRREGHVIAEQLRKVNELEKIGRILEEHQETQSSSMSQTPD